MPRCQNIFELSGTTSIPDTGNYVHIIGKKQYEYSNHLGNVLATTSDKLIAKDWNNDNTVDSYKAEILSATDYTPFGVAMDGRTFTADKARYGFNGKEKDDEWNVDGGSYDFGARMYDSRLGRWLSVDRYKSKYPNQAPYCFGANNPLYFTDINGDTISRTIIIKDIKGNVIYKKTYLDPNAVITVRHYKVIDLDPTSSNTENVTYWYTKSFDMEQTFTITAKSYDPITAKWDYDISISTYTEYNPSFLEELFNGSYEGKGSTQKSGYRLTSKNSTASKTKTKTSDKDEIPSIEIDDLMTTMGALGQEAEIGGKLDDLVWLADKISRAEELIEMRNNELKSRPTEYKCGGCGKTYPASDSLKHKGSTRTPVN